MTKQEETREELAIVLAHIDGRYWNNLTIEEASDYIKKTESVVLKVEGELPAPNLTSTVPDPTGRQAGFEEGWSYCKKCSKEAGYVAVEPLVEEK